MAAPNMSEDEAAEKAKDRLVEINSRLYDRATAYTNLILVGGYAGAFTIWNFTRKELPSKATIACALLLSISLAVFVFFEVYKMVSGTIRFNKISAILRTATSSRDFVGKYVQLDKEAAETNLLNTRIWAVCLTACVLTALIPILDLIYNFFAILIGLPMWPS